MNIRIAIPEDLSGLVQMGQQLWPALSQPELEDSFSSTFTSPKEVTFIGEVNNTSFGFAIFSLRSDYVEGSKESPTGYLEGIFILPKFRHQGLAQALVAEGEKWCLARGCGQMGSDTEIDNLVSQHFHQKIGFNETNRIVCFIKDIKWE